LIDHLGLLFVPAGTASGIGHGAQCLLDCLRGARLGQGLGFGP
jgi:hypothetical protein